MGSDQDHLLPLGSVDVSHFAGNLQQILNMLLVQQLPPTLPESMEPAVKAIVANALQHEAGSVGGDGGARFKISVIGRSFTSY